MEYFELHPQTPQLRFINRAVEILKNGGIIIYPTDTVYGIGCDIFNRNAIERIFHIKNLEQQKLFSFICSDLKDISKYARVTDSAYRSMKHHLPGPYTFILPAARLVPKKLWSKRKTVGIRVPDHAITIKLAEGLGNPLISTSATNENGEIMNDPEIIRSYFNKKVDLMLSAGNLKGEPSSVIDLSEDEPQVIREGAGDVSLFLP